MKLKRILKIVLALAAAFVLILLTAFLALRAYLDPDAGRINGVQYGQRNGKPLTMDVITPAKPRGIGIIMMVSGGWKSVPAGKFPAYWVTPLLRRGYTVFAVSHISQPDATVMDTVADVNRAARFIRHNANLYGIDPNHLGVTGASSGGHLSLMLAVGGGPGMPDAADAVDRESSAVQAVAIFFPPTDLLNLGTSTENAGEGKPPKSFVKAFGPDATNPAVWRVIGREISPIYHVHSNLPPILIIHGDKDRLVPPDQSTRFQTEAQKDGDTVKIIFHHGGGHGWLTMVLDFQKFADWYDNYLRQENSKPPEMPSSTSTN